MWDVIFNLLYEVHQGITPYHFLHSALIAQFTNVNIIDLLY